MTMIDGSAEPLADVTGLRTFVVDTVFRRDLGGGVASIINCRKQNGVLIPQCEVIISVEHLLTIAKGVNEFAHEMYQRRLWERLHAVRMDGPAH